MDFIITQVSQHPSPGDLLCGDHSCALCGALARYATPSTSASWRRPASYSNHKSTLMHTLAW
jgi:hypothetical protein